LFGILELCVAGVLLILCVQLPGSGEIRSGFGHAEDISARAGKQVRLFRQQVSELRRPELQHLSRQFQNETRTVTAQLRGQSVDYDTLRTMRDSFGDVAEGLDMLAGTLDAGQLDQVGKSLGETATFLDEKVVPTSERTGTQLDDLSTSLRADAERLGRLTRNASVDAKSAREIHDSLGRFSAGLDRMQTSLTRDRLDRMRVEFTNLEESLKGGAKQIETVADYGYPTMTFDGLFPRMEKKSFWPEGKQIAASMRRAAGSARLASDEVQRMSGNLPEVRASLQESRKVVDTTRTALAKALDQDIMQELPASLARLAQEMPRVSANLGRVLRDTRHLKELARMLRRAEKGFDVAVERWPEFQRMLARSADLMKAARRQLDYTLEHRQEYESALRQTISVADTFGSMLPEWIDHLDHQLAEQERGLDNLSASIDSFHEAVPGYAQTAENFMGTLRWLLVLVAVVVGLHGGTLMGHGMRRPVASAS
jgi:hypothetical protein